MVALAAARAVASERSREFLDDLLSDAIALMARAADRGQETLFSEARILFQTALGASDARILVRSAGTWREWDRLDNEDGLEPVVAALAESLHPTGAPVRRGGLIAAPVSGSGVAVVLETSEDAEIPVARLQNSVPDLFACDRLMREPARQSGQARGDQGLPAGRKPDPQERRPERNLHADHP